MKSARRGVFDAQAFLDSTGVPCRSLDYRQAEIVYMQGDSSNHVFYIQKGNVKLSVVSKAGRQAVVAKLRRGDFFGEGCLAEQPVRLATATATADSSILRVRKDRMVRLLHKEHAMSDRFIAYMLARNLRTEQDLIEQLFNSSEKRLARTLLLLARYGAHGKPLRAVPPISRERLAEMVGTTRARVNFYMRKFRRLGFIDGTNGLEIDPSLLTVVLRD